MQHLAIVPWIMVLSTASAGASVGDGYPDPLPRTYAQDLERPLVLVSASALLGSEVDNRGEMFGELCDLVVDRCTGRARYAVVGGNGVLGTTVRIAVPYEELVWRSDDGKFHCDLTPDRLRQLEIFSVDRLQKLGCTAAEPSGPAPARLDPHATFFAGRQAVPADGAIVAVLGWSHDDIPEPQVALAVRLRAGDEQRFLLGPSDFVAKAFRIPPAAGQRISIEAVLCSDDVGPLWVAKTARVADSVVHLRDDDGNPLWETRRHALVSELAKCVVVAQCKSSDGALGPVQNVVLDTRTGQLVFVTVEFEGELRAIPMRALSIVGDGRLELARVSRDACQGAPHLLGDEIAELNDPNLRAGIYSFFGVDPGRVLPR